MIKKFLRKHNWVYLAVPLLILLAVGILSLTSRKLITTINCCGVHDFAEHYDPNPPQASFEGKKIDVPKLTLTTAPTQVLGENTGEKWIEIILSQQKLKAWQGNQLYLETFVSTGLPWFPTPTGEFHIWLKVRSTLMEGGTGRYYYYLPNVPYVQFFENDKVPGWRGYSLHGTYWHNDFGHVHSHGCVNLPTPMAEKLYYWTQPNLPNGKGSVRADAANPGTKVVIHE